MPFGKKKDKSAEAEKSKYGYPTGAYPTASYPSQAPAAPGPQQMYGPPGAPPAYQGPPPPYTAQAAPGYPQDGQATPPQGYPGAPPQGYSGYQAVPPQGYQPAPQGYAAAPPQQYAQMAPPGSTTVVLNGGYDAGARFDGVAQPNIPPPPPGVMPNAAQMAMTRGNNVVVTQRPGNFWDGGSDGGYVMF